MRKTFLIVIVICVVLGIFYFLNKKEAVAPATEKNKPIELCFAKFGVPNDLGFADKYTLRMLLDGGKVTGELNLLPAEKDSKVGKFEGTVTPIDKMMMARTANLWWNSFAEGMNVKEELKIVFGEGNASVGFGEMVDRGDGVYVYKDPQNISYSLALADVACTDLTERANVENYLRDNISLLSPIKAQMGGTWYVVSTTIDVGKNSGLVLYEDGHFQEKRTFSYTTNEKGEVISLIIK